MVANAKTGSTLEEGEIVLELGLSTGANYSKRKAEKFDCFRILNGSELQSVDGGSVDVDADAAEMQTTRRSVSPSLMGGGHKQEFEHVTMSKRETQALRRQAAKKKREEKQLKRRNVVVCNKVKMGLCVEDRTAALNNVMWAKAKDFQANEDRDQFEAEVPKFKKSRTEDAVSHISSSEITSVRLNLGTKRNDSPVCPTQCPYPDRPLQFGSPAANWYAYPCANVNVVPCCSTGGPPDVGREANVIRPAARHCFGSFGAPLDTRRGLTNGRDSEHTYRRDEGYRKVAGSSSSSICASEGSDHNSSSDGGCCRSNIISESIHFIREQLQLNPNGSRSRNYKNQSIYSATTHLTKPDAVNEALEATNPVKEKVVSNCSQSGWDRSEGETKPDTVLVSVDKQISDGESPTTQVPGEISRGMAKPPKHGYQIQRTSSLPYMPCVSTTGNGPNGRTINGFLYRYSKAEVIIVCVCHGSSFSPAKFVEHAGGTDVSHPLRLINVVPSVF